MEKTLRLLDTFAAQGSDGKAYRVHAYEHLARLDAVPDMHADWEPTGQSEYKLADGRHVKVERDGSMLLAEAGVRLERA
ncbi:MAG TPA: hypothetical protein VLA16_10155 [Ideonella sp.]|nr:hypothetical protein [Ideonella sp.]